MTRDEIFRSPFPVNMQALQGHAHSPFLSQSSIAFSLSMAVSLKYRDDPSSRALRLVNASSATDARSPALT
jgi:hypothetical protein